MRLDNGLPGVWQNFSIKCESKYNRFHSTFIHEMNSKMWSTARKTTANLSRSQRVNSLMSGLKYTHFGKLGQSWFRYWLLTSEYIYIYIYIMPWEILLHITAVYLMYILKLNATVTTSCVMFMCHIRVYASQATSNSTFLFNKVFGLTSEIIKAPHCTSGR